MLCRREKTDGGHDRRRVHFRRIPPGRKRDFRFARVGGVSEECEVKFRNNGSIRIDCLSECLEKARANLLCLLFVCIYAGSRLISGSGLRIMPFRYEAVRVCRHCRALPRLRFSAYREESPTVVGIIEDARRGKRSRCAPERRIGEVSVSAAFSRRIGAVIGFRRAFRLYGGTVSAQGVSRSAQRLGSGVCPAGSASGTALSVTTASAFS